MPKDHQTNILFVKALADDQPIEKRIELYRWLANMAGSEWLTQQILQQATALEGMQKIDKEIQLWLDTKGLEETGNGERKGNGEGK